VLFSWLQGEGAWEILRKAEYALRTGNLDPPGDLTIEEQKGGGARFTGRRWDGRRICPPC
jgi:hypothetical protein